MKEHGKGLGRTKKLHNQQKLVFTHFRIGCKHVDDTEWHASLMNGSLSNSSFSLLCINNSQKKNDVSPLQSSNVSSLMNMMHSHKWHSKKTLDIFI